MKILIIAAAFAFALPALAQEVLPPPDRAVQDSTAPLPANRKYEMQFDPELGYSNLSGLNLGLHGVFLIPLNKHWQFKMGAAIKLNKYFTTDRYTLGAQYNFSDDWTESFYVGTGIGYKRTNGVDNYGRYDEASTFGYVDFGKRIKLNSSGTIAWTPNITLEGQPNQPASVSVHPLNFSWSF